MDSFLSGFGAVKCIRSPDKCFSLFRTPGSMGGPQPPAEGNASSATSPRTSSIARSTKPGHVSKLRSTFGARQSSFGAGRASARPSSAKLTAAEPRAKKAAQEEAIRQHNAMMKEKLASTKSKSSHALTAEQLAAREEAALRKKQEAEDKRRRLEASNLRHSTKLSSATAKSEMKLTPEQLAAREAVATRKRSESEEKRRQLEAANAKHSENLSSVTAKSEMALTAEQEAAREAVATRKRSESEEKRRQLEAAMQVQRLQQQRAAPPEPRGRRRGHDPGGPRAGRLRAPVALGLRGERPDLGVLRGRHGRRVSPRPPFAIRPLRPRAPIPLRAHISRREFVVYAFLYVMLKET